MGLSPKPPITQTPLKGDPNHHATTNNALQRRLSLSPCQVVPCPGLLGMHTAQAPGNNSDSGSNSNRLPSCGMALPDACSSAGGAAVAPVPRGETDRERDRRVAGQQQQQLGGSRHASSAPASADSQAVTATRTSAGNTRMSTTSVGSTSVEEDEEEEEEESIRSSNGETTPGGRGSRSGRTAGDASGSGGGRVSTAGRESAPGSVDRRVTLRSRLGNWPLLSSLSSRLSSRKETSSPGVKGGTEDDDDDDDDETATATTETETTTIATVGGGESGSLHNKAGVRGRRGRDEEGGGSSAGSFSVSRCIGSPGVGRSRAGELGSSGNRVSTKSPSRAIQPSTLTIPAIETFSEPSTSDSAYETSSGGSRSGGNHAAPQAQSKVWTRKKAAWSPSSSQVPSSIDGNFSALSTPDSNLPPSAFRTSSRPTAALDARTPSQGSDRASVASFSLRATNSVARTNSSSPATPHLSGRLGKGNPSPFTAMPGGGVGGQQLQEKSGSEKAGDMGSRQAAVRVPIKESLSFSGAKEEGGGESQWKQWGSGSNGVGRSSSRGSQSTDNSMSREGGGNSGRGEASRSSSVQDKQSREVERSRGGAQSERGRTEKANQSGRPSEQKDREAGRLRLEALPGAAERDGGNPTSLTDPHNVIRDHASFWAGVGGWGDHSEELSAELSLSSEISLRMGGFGGAELAGAKPSVPSKPLVIPFSPILTGVPAHTRSDSPSVAPLAQAVAMSQSETESDRQLPVGRRFGGRVGPTDSMEVGYAGSSNNASPRGSETDGPTKGRVVGKRPPLPTPSRRPGTVTATAPSPGSANAPSGRYDSAGSGLSETGSSGSEESESEGSDGSEDDEEDEDEDEDEEESEEEESSAVSNEGGESVGISDGRGKGDGSLATRGTESSMSKDSVDIEPRRSWKSVAAVERMRHNSPVTEASSQTQKQDFSTDISLSPSFKDDAESNASQAIRNLQTQRTKQRQVS